MGTCSSSNDTTKMPFKVAKYFQYISDLNCEHNVNKSYSHLIRIDRTAFVGAGIKKTQAYIFLGTREQLTKSRKQFWETRTMGKQQCWTAIKNSLQEQNQKTAFQILSSKKVFLYKENIQTCYDIAYNCYQIPIFCINQPSKFIKNQQQYVSQKKLYQAQDIEIRIRCVKFPTSDYSMNCSLNTPIQYVKSCFKQNKKIGQKQKLRMFFNGKQMLDGRLMGDYGCFNNCVLQGMLIS